MSNLHRSVGAKMKPCLGQRGIAYELGQAKKENSIYNNVNKIMNYAKNTHYIKKSLFLVCKYVAEVKHSLTGISDYYWAYIYV